MALKTQLFCALAEVQNYREQKPMLQSLHSVPIYLSTFSLLKDCDHDVKVIFMPLKMSVTLQPTTDQAPQNSKRNFTSSPPLNTVSPFSYTGEYKQKVICDSMQDLNF